jgi:hypothetical protein
MKFATLVSILALPLLLQLALQPMAFANPADPDTTWVLTFDRDFYNWATPHIRTFDFPPAGNAYREVLLYYTIECPGPPADCDPWDRLGYLHVLHEEPVGVETPYEIARIITPYDITGGNYPGSCTWVLDVTDYRFLLHDEVTLSNYISTWIGDNRGWLVTIEFAFIAGANPLEAYKIINLWTDSYLVYGEPADPVEDHLQPIPLEIDAAAEAVKFRSIATGHGQGNTDNAAEFSYKWHRFLVNGLGITHFLWRSDCATNPCSPQGGTWTYNRAGWCPGDKVTPWDEDISFLVSPGASVELDYDIQPYENYCRPTNPECVDGVTCADCDYNYTGHTEPHYVLSTQLIYYRSPLSDVGEEITENPGGLQIEKNYPNPFNPLTTFAYTITGPGEVQIAIYSLDGKLVRRATRRHAASGTFPYSWDGRDANGTPLPSGVYIYAVAAGGERTAGKMMLLK